MNKNKWMQVGGDMTWEKHGVVLARDDGRYVEVVKIDEWANMDSSAIFQGYGLYNKQEGSVDYDDLGEGVLPGALPDDIKDRLRYSGIDEEEYAKLAPIYKGALYFEGGGWDSDVSSNDLLGLLPDKPENIEFWGGKETTDKVKQYALDERRDAIQQEFDRMNFGELPNDEALEFAIGDDGYTFELDDNQRTGLGYAALFRKIPGEAHSMRGAFTLKVDDANDFKKIIAALVEAPTGEDAVPNDINKAHKYFGYDQDLANIPEFMTEASESAHELATALMEGIGFSWR